MTERLEQLFGEAIELPPSERMAFLERACANDSVLLRRLEIMIETHARAEKLAFFTRGTGNFGDKRPAFLAAVCGGDAALQAQVEALLNADQMAEGFLPSKPGVDGLETCVLSPAEQPGDKIGHYKLLQKIGEGGCGVVYMSEQTEPVRRPVALKIIKLGMDSKQVIARFEAERQVLAMMEHPNIAKVHDAGVTETGRPYFVMELVRGVKITDFCDENNLSTNQRLELVIPICHALQHAHQKGIIHRDIKPSNILVSVNDGIPVPKLIDFGIAKATSGQQLTDKTLFTAFEQFIGTPAYMSPEQALMTSLDIDTRSDVYSLGVLLYELLTGETPFDGNELLAIGFDEMRRTIREKDPERPSTRLRSMTQGDLTTTAKRRHSDPAKLLKLMRRDLDWIVMKCLEKDRARRYETAHGLAMDLRRHLAAEPVLARPPSTPYRLQRLVVRNKLAFAAIVAVAITLVVGLTAALFGWQAARTERENAVQAQLKETQQRQWAELNLYAADMNLAARALAAGNRGQALELLGKHRRGAVQEDLRGWEWRYLWKRCEGKEGFTLPGHNGRTHVLVFSRDSNTLVSGDTKVSGDTPKGVVRVWDLVSRKAVRTITIDRLIYGLAIAPDGQALFIGWPDGVAIYDGPSFDRVRPLPGAQGPLALSPDGRMLVTGGTNGPVVWDPVSLKELYRSNGRQGFIPPRSEISFSPDSSMVAIPKGWPGGRLEITVWDAAGLRQKGFEGPPMSVLQRDGSETQDVYGLAFSTDGQILATSPGFQLWNPKTGRPLSPLESSVEVLNMRFLPDGKTLLTFGWEQNFRLWDISTRTNMAFLRVVPGHENEIWSAAVAPNGLILASGSKDGMIKVWNMKTFQEAPQVKDRIDAPEIADLVFPQVGRTMYSITLDGAFTSWDTETLQARASANLAGRLIVALFSPRGTHLAVGSTNGAVELWRVDEPNINPRSSQELLPPQPESFKPFFITLKKDGELSPAFPLMTWSRNGKTLAAFVNKLYVWDIAAARSGKKLSIPVKPDAIALSPDGSILAAAAGENIQLWDVRADQQLSTLMGHKESITHLAFSPDGKTLASVSFDNTAALWDVPSRSLRWPLTSHTQSVTHLEFSPDGRALATRGADDTLRLWHVQTGRELITMEMLLADWGPAFRGVRFSLDGTMMAVGLPTQIRFLRAPSLAELDAAEATGAGKNRLQEVSNGVASK